MVSLCCEVLVVFSGRAENKVHVAKTIGTVSNMIHRAETEYKRDLLTKDETNVLHNLYLLAVQSGIGVGMKQLLPPVVQKLTAQGYCTVVEIENPHSIPDNPQVLVELTQSARELLDLQYASTRSPQNGGSVDADGEPA